MRIPRFIAPFIAAVLVAVGIACWPSSATSNPPPRLLVIGDSMSAWYSEEPGSVSEAWWSIVARELGGAQVTLSAETGSGMWARGNKCQGTRAGDRLHEVDRVRPDRIIVALGFNDTHGCDSRHRKVPIYRSSTEKATTSYLTALAKRVDAAGLDRSNVDVFTPWGSTKRDSHVWLWRHQQAVATKLGFRYVVVRFNDRDATIDGIHPNRKGNADMAARYLAGAKR